MSPHSSVECASHDDVASSSSSGNDDAFVSQKHSTLALQPGKPDAVYDLVGVGFGPASLAVAIALHDALEAGTVTPSPRVLFLEKQQDFAWHAGMLLPDAKMQISFIKDLATLRDPRSSFTFLNYLHRSQRLVEFTNLNTFLPARVEYEDYLRWSARHFNNVVKYHNEVVSVSPVRTGSGPLSEFVVTSRNVETGTLSKERAKNVLIAVGGQPFIPRSLPVHHPKVIHSSQYAHMVPKLLADKSAPYRVAVIGAGQSAAEIFINIQKLYPNSRTWLIMRSEFLKPSDDSPFVNSIFNPNFVDYLYPRSATYRQSLIADARATNYGVVRLELIEYLYERMYDQRRELGTDERRWPHRILGGRHILEVDDDHGAKSLFVKVCEVSPSEHILDGPGEDEEILNVDLVIAATGYSRTAHVEMLRNMWDLLPPREDKHRSTDGIIQTEDRWIVQSNTPGHDEDSKTRVLEVDRDYKVRFLPGTVASDSGIWLQGCCEGSHGLSDTLLSVLATRSGEIVNSIFGKNL